MLVYTVSKAAVDAPISIEQSADLTLWQAADANLQQVSCEDLGSLARLTMRLNVPVNAATQQFLRLRVTRLTAP